MLLQNTVRSRRDMLKEEFEKIAGEYQKNVWPKKGDRVRIKGVYNIREYDGKTATVYDASPKYGVAMIVDDPPPGRTNPWWLNIRSEWVAELLTIMEEEN
jgi:hypothetical protein